MEGRRLGRPAASRALLGMSSAAKTAVRETGVQDDRIRRRRRRARGVTPLMYAAQQGDVDRVRRIIRAQSSSLFDRDRTGKSALHYCCTSDSLCAAHAADFLVMAAPDLVEGRDEDGFTPLHLAAIAGNMQLVTFLLANDADVNAVDNEKHTVVHWATVCGETAALRAVLAAGAPVSTPDVHGGYPLHYAAQMCGGTGNDRDSSLGMQVLQTLLCHKDIVVSVADGDKRQPLLWAASAGSSKAVLALVRAGAAVEAADKDGLTALHCAASRGHTDCLDTLLTLCGASPDVIDSNGCTALHYAVTLGHADATALLLAHGADPNRQDRKGRSPAHCGCAKGQFETVKLIGSHRANLWLRNARGDLPLHEAAASGRRELVKWLLEMRPSQVNARNNDGRCPLHMAALNDNADMCKILLDAGAQVNPVLRTSRNVFMTPLDCALQRGFRSTAKFLQLHGGIPANRLADLKNPPASSVNLQIRDDVTFWGDSSSGSEREKGEALKSGKKSYRKKMMHKLEKTKISLSGSEDEIEKVESSKLESSGKPKRKPSDKSGERKSSATPPVSSTKRSSSKKLPSSRIEYTNEIIINGKTEINIHQTREIIVEKEPTITEKVTETVISSETIPQSASSVKERRPRSAKFSKGKDRSGRSSAEKGSAKARGSITTPKTIMQQENETRQLSSLKTQSTNTSEETVIENKLYKPPTAAPEDGFLKDSLDSKRVLDQQSLRSNTSEDVEEHKEFVVEASVHEPPKSHLESEQKDLLEPTQKDGDTTESNQEGLQSQENGEAGTLKHVNEEESTKIKERDIKEGVKDVDSMNKENGTTNDGIDSAIKEGVHPKEDTHNITSEAEQKAEVSGNATLNIKGADLEKTEDRKEEVTDTPTSNEDNDKGSGDIKSQEKLPTSEDATTELESKENNIENTENVTKSNIKDTPVDEAETNVQEVGSKQSEKQDETPESKPDDQSQTVVTELDENKDNITNQQDSDKNIEELHKETQPVSEQNVDKTVSQLQDTAEIAQILDKVDVNAIVQGTLKEIEVEASKESIHAQNDGKGKTNISSKPVDLNENEVTKKLNADMLPTKKETDDHLENGSGRRKENVVTKDQIESMDKTPINGKEKINESDKKRSSKQKELKQKHDIEAPDEKSKTKDLSKKKKHLKVEEPSKKTKGKKDDDSDEEYSSRSDDVSLSTPTRKSHKSFRVLDEGEPESLGKSKASRSKRNEKKEPRSRSEENKKKGGSKERSKQKHSRIPMPLGKTTLSKSDRHLDKAHVLEKRALQGVLDARIPSLPNIHQGKGQLKEPLRSESNMSAPLLASPYSDNESMSEAEHDNRSLVARNRKRVKKKPKTREARSAGSDYESSNLIDSGFEPSPRSTRIPKWKNMSDRGVNMTSVTQNIQSNIRRYHLERKIFQHLLELKRHQIRAGQHNEAVLVKRAIDAYHQSCASTVGAGRYIPEDFSFKSFEKFLYESLRKLQKNDVEYMKGLPEAPTNPLLCTRSTNRCMHATHAYTGVPCAAYLPKMDHHTIPKIGFNNVSCKPGTGFLPEINSKKAVTLELSHGADKQVISLPTDRLDHNKRYYVTFTVKGHDPSSSNEEGPNTNAHMHSKSD